MNLFTLVLKEWNGVALDGTGVATFVADGCVAKQRGLRAGAHLLKVNGKDLSNSSLKDTMESLQVETNRPLRLLFSQPRNSSEERSPVHSPRTNQSGFSTCPKSVDKSGSSVKPYKRRYRENSSDKTQEPYKLRRVSQEASRLSQSRYPTVPSCHSNRKGLTRRRYAVPSIGRIPAQVLQSLSRHQTWTSERSTHEVRQRSSIPTLSSPVIQDVQTKSNYREFFDLFDKDRDGFISSVEMRDILRMMKYHVEDSEIQELFAQMKRQVRSCTTSPSSSPPGDNRISFDDFYAFAVSRPRQCVRNEVSWREFQRLDEDRDGLVTSDQLVRFMRGLFKLDQVDTNKLRAFLTAQGISPEDGIDYETYDSIMRNCM